MNIILPDKFTAQARADALTEARLREVWGDAYRGQKTWPDGFTDRATAPIEQPSDGRAALPLDPRHTKHLTAQERGAIKTREELRDDGWERDAELEQ